MSVSDEHKLSLIIASLIFSFIAILISIIYILSFLPIDYLIIIFVISFGIAILLKPSKITDKYGFTYYPNNFGFSEATFIICSIISIVSFFIIANYFAPN